MEFNSREVFIMLDALSKKRGGSKNLTSEEKLEYVQSGITAGFLSIKEAYQLAKNLNVDKSSIFNHYFKDLQSKE